MVLPPRSFQKAEDGRLSCHQDTEQGSLSARRGLNFVNLDVYHTMKHISHEVTSFSVAVAVEKQRRFFVDNLMLGVQLALHQALSCPQRIFVVSLHISHADTRI